MFDFIIKYGGPLKYIPLFPMLFDSILILWNILFNKKMINCIEEIEEEVKKWEGIDISIHKYGGIQFNYKKREIGHIHGNGLVDILFNRTIKKKLLFERKAEEHHVFKNSGWTSFYIQSEKDKDHVLELLMLSYQMKNE